MSLAAPSSQVTATKKHPHDGDIVDFVFKARHVVLNNHDKKLEALYEARRFFVLNNASLVKRDRMYHGTEKISDRIPCNLTREKESLKHWQR